MLRAVLLVEVLGIHAIGIALHGERPAVQVRQQHGSNAHEIVDDLSLGEPGLGIEHLIEVRHLQVLALDVNYYVFVLGHCFPVVGMMPGEREVCNLVIPKLEQNDTDFKYVISTCQYPKGAVNDFKYKETK